MNDPSKIRKSSSTGQVNGQNEQDRGPEFDPQLQNDQQQRFGHLQNTKNSNRSSKTKSKRFRTLIISPQQGQNTGQANGFGGGLGNGNGLIAAAKALLKAVALNTVRTITNNPVVMLAKNFFNKTLVQTAVSLLEAAQIDEILGAGDKQQIILLLAQAKTVDGEASQNIEYWKQVIQENKQLEKQTHDLAKAS